MHTHTLWAARVAAGTVLPDKRLAARLACILETFAERPSDAIPQAAGSWGQAKGIYRFLAPKELPREVRPFWRRVRSVLARVRSVLKGLLPLESPC